MSLKKRISIILLAADSSTRMGKPIYNLEWKEKTVLNHCINIAEKSNSDNVFVVLGAYADEIDTRHNEKTKVMINHNWHCGISKSIERGIIGSSIKVGSKVNKL